jgi:hypothetical protein
VTRQICPPPSNSTLFSLLQGEHLPPSPLPLNRSAATTQTRPTFAPDPNTQPPIFFPAFFAPPQRFSLVYHHLSIGSTLPTLDRQTSPFHNDTLETILRAHTSFDHKSPSTVATTAQSHESIPPILLEFQPAADRQQHKQAVNPARNPSQAFSSLTPQESLSDFPLMCPAPPPNCSFNLRASSNFSGLHHNAGIRQLTPRRRRRSICATKDPAVLEDWVG